KSFEPTEVFTPLDFNWFSRNGIFVEYPNAVHKLGDESLIFLKVNNTLLLSGDVELNPGPSVQGSFHQGNRKFGETAGIQCSSNCFFAICYAQFRKLSLWKTHDLDYVLDQGDLNFKKLGIVGNSPYIEEFSRSIDIGGSDFNTDGFELDKREQLLVEVLSNYTLMTRFPTHVDGKMLDHVWVQKELSIHYDIQVIRKCVNLSDHDAVKISLSKK
uniref:Uncharacterized protein n=1 Tax=Clytia hemisphaerica TaxID=252671 RepID=A0A7M5V1Y9_9CNID